MTRRILTVVLGGLLLAGCAGKVAHPIERPLPPCIEEIPAGWGCGWRTRGPDGASCCRSIHRVPVERRG